MLVPMTRVCDICAKPVLREDSIEFFNITGDNGKGMTRKYDVCSPCMLKMIQHIEGTKYFNDEGDTNEET